MNHQYRLRGLTVEERKQHPDKVCVAIGDDDSPVTLPMTEEEARRFLKEQDTAPYEIVISGLSKEQALTLYAVQIGMAREDLFESGPCFMGAARAYSTPNQLVTVTAKPVVTD